MWLWAEAPKQSWFWRVINVGRALLSRISGQTFWGCNSSLTDGLYAVGVESLAVFKAVTTVWVWLPTQNLRRAAICRGGVDISGKDYGLFFFFPHLNMETQFLSVPPVLCSHSLNRTGRLTLCTHDFAFRKNSSTVVLSFKNDMLSM